MNIAAIVRRLNGTGSSGKRARILKAAQEAKSNHDWRRAADLYRSALILRDSFGPRVQLAHMLKEAGELEAAEAAYLESLKERPNDAELNVQIGHFYWVKGDSSMSLQYYERAAEIAPEDGSILNTLRTGQMRAADAPWQGRINAGMEAMRQGRWVAAEDDLRPLVEAGRRDYLLVLAHAVKEQGRLDEAVVLYDAYRRYVSPEGGSLAYDGEVQYANALQLAQRFSEAALHFSNARMMRMETQGWTGSEDHLLEQIRICIRQVHPAIDPSRIR